MASWSSGLAGCWAAPITVESETDRLRPAASEVERLLAGTALAQSLWNWKPRYSLDQGLEETIAWIREHIGRFRTEQLHHLKETATIIAETLGAIHIEGSVCPAFAGSLVIGSANRTVRTLRVHCPQ